MSDSLKVIKPGVRALRAYALSPDRALVKINQNENPWDAPERVKEETWRRLAARKWSRYPDFVPLRLQEKLAAFAGWTADGVIAGNGSNELIQALLMVTLGEGKRVLISEPTFALYRQISTVLGAEVTSIPLNSALSYDVDAIHQAIMTIGPDVTIICSPNNPSGCVIADRELEDLLASARGIVVVDEAYHEFARHSVVPLLRAHPNLIVLRTFSKAMALAGLRVGYLLAAPELTHEISKAVLPYNLNVISQTAAEVAVEMYDGELRPMVQKIVNERERLFVEIGNIPGLDPVASHGNFLLVRSAIEPRKVFRHLLQSDILIRDVSGYPMLAEYFRVSVGTPEETNKLIASLRDMFRARQV